MPLYDYICPYCGHEAEIILKVIDLGKIIECSQCGTGMDKVIVHGHGGGHTDKPKWINDELRGSIQDEWEKPIETRDDLERVRKEKGIEPIETSQKGLRMI